MGHRRRQAAILEDVRVEVGYHSAWARWSATADELGELVDVILRHPTGTVRDLLAKFDALTWLLLADGAVLDHAAERQVRAFGRELRELGGQRGKSGI